MPPAVTQSRRYIASCPGSGIRHCRLRPSRYQAPCSSIHSPCVARAPPRLFCALGVVFVLNRGRVGLAGRNASPTTTRHPRLTQGTATYGAPRVAAVFASSNKSGEKQLRLLQGVRFHHLASGHVRVPCWYLRYSDVAIDRPVHHWSTSRPRSTRKTSDHCDTPSNDQSPAQTSNVLP